MEYMGFFTFCQMIVGWLPSLLYTVMNEAGIEQKYSMCFIGVYPILSLFCSLGSGNYNKAVTHAGSFIRDTKRKSSKLTGQENEKEICTKINDAENDNVKQSSMDVSKQLITVDAQESRDDFLPNNGV
jgi:hypothetical protein